MHQHFEMIGRIGHDLELKRTKDGIAVMTLRVATNEYHGRGQDRREHTEWHAVVVWDRIAEAVAQYCRKASLIHVTGVLRTRKWTDGAGHDHWTTEIMAKHVNFLKHPGNALSLDAPGGDNQPPMDDEDIPF